MRTEQLEHNELTAEAYAWYRHYLSALDTKDIATYSTFLADNCELIMNNAAPLQGKAAVVSGLDAYWQTFATIEHDLLGLYGNDNSFCLEALNHYTRLDGAPVTLRAVAFTERDDQGLVSSVRLYTDTTPLFS